ncbi:patatin-like phospholipase family protein [Planktothrix rubescens]|uniref:patatin-like phospholipase family protein n=1 Tax=Planktothrix rubescens TaxID=59512 RepID=UPI00040F1886|nr:patatin-like phospholipase family protein [Planktothrix rubescens]
MTLENTSPNPSQISLNLSGGIALGAYMAGVCFELVRQARKDNSPLLIDLITGASAGAMTGAITAYYLLNREITDTEYESQNILQRAWVEKADMKDIDTVFAIEDYRQVLNNLFNSQNESLLSQKGIKNIANLITENTDQLKVHQPLALVMTVTNLQGLLVTYENKCRNFSGIPAVNHAETRQFLFHSELNRQGDRLQKIWKKVIDTSLISGAFPVAFPPIQDSSNVKSYNLKNLSSAYFTISDESRKQQLDPALPMFCSQETLKFWYSDGGILDNLPILKAIDLEARIYLTSLPNSEYLIQEEGADFIKFSHDFNIKTKAEREQRIYAYVSPSSLENLESRPSLKKNNFNLFDLLFDGLNIPSAQQDAIQLKKIVEINQQVDYKENILSLLETLPTNQSGETVSKIKTDLEKAIPYHHIQLSPITPLILNQISGIENVEAQEELENLYKKFRYLFKTPLVEKPTDVEQVLASDFINAFGGFFDRKYREQDFILGRLCGLTWLHLNFNQIDTKSSISRLNQIFDSGQIQFDNPKFKDLKISYRIRLIRLLVRGLRMMTVQTQMKNSNKILLGLFQVILLPLFLFIEILLTLGLILTEIIETFWEKINQK